LWVPFKNENSPTDGVKHYTKRWRQSSRWKQPVRKYDMIWRGKEERGRKWWRGSKAGNTSRQTDGRAWLLADLHKSKTKGSGRHNALNLSEHPKSNCSVHLYHIPHKWKRQKWT